MACLPRLLHSSERARLEQLTACVLPHVCPVTDRNIVKALPWFTDVRVKLEDPQYHGWFLHRKDNASALYFDTRQTVPGDCGGVTCGEYLCSLRPTVLWHTLRPLAFNFTQPLRTDLYGHSHGRHSCSLHIALLCCFRKRNAARQKSTVRTTHKAQHCCQTSVQV